MSNFEYCVEAKFANEWRSVGIGPMPEFYLVVDDFRAWQDEGYEVRYMKRKVGEWEQIY